MCVCLEHTNQVGLWVVVVHRVAPSRYMSKVYSLHGHVQKSFTIDCLILYFTQQCNSIVSYKDREGECYC